VATLTYVYADSTAVLGPLATFAEPHTYDLCAFHADRLTAPQHWELVRLVTDYEAPPEPGDDLLAVADAVRDNAAREQATRRAEDQPQTSPYVERQRRVAGGTGSAFGVDGPEAGDRRGHLRVLREGGTAGGDR